MKPHALFLGAVLSILFAAGAHADDEPFGNLRLVQEIDCAKPVADAAFAEMPAGASRVETVLGTPCRVLPNQEGGGRFFAYRVGKGMGLKAGGCYVLSVEFPDDKPRGFQILVVGQFEIGRIIWR